MKTEWARLLQPTEVAQKLAHDALAYALLPGMMYNNKSYYRVSDPEK